MSNQRFFMSWGRVLRNKFGQDFLIGLAADCGMKLFGEAVGEVSW